MAKINIPRSEYGVLRDIAELPDASFSEFLRGLVEIEPEISQLEFSGLLSKKVPSINTADLKKFLRTIFALYRLMDTKERTAHNLSEDIREAIEREKPQAFPMAKIEVLVQRIQELLGVGGLVATAAKAVSLILEQERIFCGARIFSDVRPVFAESPDSISAALVLHSLNISFHQDDEHKEIFVTLTTSELQTLKKAVERAEKKYESLKTFIQKTGVKFLSEGE
jgi:hypothetical protein